jgi:hypothetical protein
MSDEVLLALVALLVSALIYFAGVQRGARQERARQSHEERLERERNDRRLAEKVADEYVHLVRNARDSGPHALASLGLQSLGSDALIRHAIHEMKVRTGKNPWAGEESHIEGVDLVEFFRLATENRVNFFSTPVAEHAAFVKSKPRGQSAA